MNLLCLRVVCTAAGAVTGYLILHPYAMLVSHITATEHSLPLIKDWGHWSIFAFTAFQSAMAPMSFAFALFGGTIGFMTALLIDRRRRLDAAAHENEKNRAALDAVKSLMVTLSHYLLNANMIIGGKVRQCRKAASSEDILAALDVVEKQGRKIDAVLRALRNAVELKTIDYTSDGQVTMLDIAGEVDDALRKLHQRDEGQGRAQRD